MKKKGITKGNDWFTQDQMPFKAYDFVNQQVNWIQAAGRFHSWFQLSLRSNKLLFIVELIHICTLQGRSHYEANRGICLGWNFLFSFLVSFVCLFVFFAYVLSRLSRKQPQQCNKIGQWIYKFYVLNSTTMLYNKSGCMI